jgi:hypothetical protein
MGLMHSAGPAKGMAGRAHSIHHAPGIGQSHAQPSSRKPTTRRGQQNLWFHCYSSLLEAAPWSFPTADESRCKSSVVRVFLGLTQNRTLRQRPITKLEADQFSAFADRCVGCL